LRWIGKIADAALNEKNNKYKEVTSIKAMEGMQLPASAVTQRFFESFSGFKNERIL